MSEPPVTAKPSASLGWYMEQPKYKRDDEVVLPQHFARKVRAILVNSDSEDEADFLLEHIKSKDETVTVPLTIATHLRDFLKGQES